MTFTDELLLTLISGLLLWIIKDISVYLLHRSRIRAALLTEVFFLIRAVKEAKQYLEDSFQKSVEKGAEVKYSAVYTPEERDIYKEYAPVLTSYLRERDLVRVLKFHRAVQEFETLCVGFFANLTEWKKQKHVLSEDDIQYLCRKKARIVSIANILTATEVHKISDLPEDYKGELDAGSIVR